MAHERRRVPFRASAAVFSSPGEGEAHGSSFIAAGLAGGRGVQLSVLTRGFSPWCHPSTARAPLQAWGATLVFF